MLVLIYLVKLTTDFTVTVSHPTRVNGTVTITVDRVGFGEGCAALSDFTY